MYEKHYGWSGRPFQLTPDPRFWFDTATHKKAMAYLGYGLSQGEGFIVITGDIGAGKTTLVGHLMDTIDRERLNIIQIVSTQIAADDLLRTVCAGFDVDAAGLSKAAMLAAIERGLHATARAGRRTLLIVDEVQALPTDSLEELRMLSNFQAGGYALLQIFLLGQPEFRDQLQHAALEQLRQRVIAMHHLGPMAADELAPYLAHRLSVVGWTGTPRFDAGAVAAIYAWSGGIPRRINQLASRILLHGAIESLDAFSCADVDLVAADLGGEAATEPAIAIGEAACDDTPPAAAVGVAPARPAATAAPAPRPVAAEPVAPTVDARPIRADAAPAAPPPPSRPAPSWMVEAPTASAATGEVDRLAVIERRMEEQDEALRRVLTLLVDWVEAGGGAGNLAELRDRVG